MSDSQYAAAGVDLQQAEDAKTRIGRLVAGTRTAKEMHGGARRILETLKAVVEDGRPKFGTRVMYWMFGKMGFVLPARTRVEHWPM